LLEAPAFLSPTHVSQKFPRLAGVSLHGGDLLAAIA